MIRGGGVAAGAVPNGSPSSQKRQSFPPTAVSPYAPPGYAAVAAADGAATAGFNAAAMPPAPTQADHASKYQLFNVMIKKNPGLGFSIAGLLGCMFFIKLCTFQFVTFGRASLQN